jgi:hypothetical protein
VSAYTHAASDALAHADTCEDPGADGRSDRYGGAGIHRSDSHGRADADAADHAVTDAVPGAGVTEPRTRGARVVRIRRDDRFSCVDLASLPQLTSAPTP